MSPERSAVDVALERLLMARRAAQPGVARRWYGPFRLPWTPAILRLRWIWLLLRVGYRWRHGLLRGRTLMAFFPVWLRVRLLLWGPTAWQLRVRIVGTWVLVHRGVLLRIIGGVLMAWAVLHFYAEIIGVLIWGGRMLARLFVGLTEMVSAYLQPDKPKLIALLTDVGPFTREDSGCP